MEPEYLIAAILIPIVYLVCSYCITWTILGDPTTGVNPAILASYALTFFPGLIASVSTAAGEEM